MWYGYVLCFAPVTKAAEAAMKMKSENGENRFEFMLLESYNECALPLLSCL